MSQPIDYKQTCIVKVRQAGDCYHARHGKGVKAIKATCTSGADMAAIACGRKVLPYKAPLSRWVLAVLIDNPETLPGLKKVDDRDVSFYRVGLASAAGGDLS